MTGSPQATISQDIRSPKATEFTHYDDSGSCNVKWLREHIEMETEGELPDWNQLDDEQREAEENGN